MINAAPITHFPVWQQDGNQWHLLVGNKTAAILHPAVRRSGVGVYVVEINSDFHGGDIAEAWHAGEFYSLPVAQDFMRRWWIVEGSKRRF